jgi:pyruvate-ferredoxin/flavodoxin oxidoreductase
MTSEGARKKFFYAGAVFAAPDRRFPHLESLRQRLDKEYPHLGGLSLAGAADAGEERKGLRAVQLYSLSVQGGLFAGNLFAQALAGALGRTVRTYPDGGLEPSIQPVNFTLCHTEEDEPITTKPLVMDAALVSGDRLLESLPARVNLRKGGAIVVETNRSSADLLRSLSRRTAGWITSAEPAVFIVDARRIAAETSSRPTFVDQLAVWALLGAYVTTAKLFSADELVRFLDHLTARLARLFEPAGYLAEDVKKCFVRGMEETSPFDWKRLALAAAPGAPEPEAPWTVQQVREHDRTVFDVNRFWHSVGYLYDRGEPEKTLTDPYLATGIVPAGSSAFRDMTPYRLRIPQWSPSLCEACGLCFAVCPDSSLPAAASTIPSIIETAFRKCEEEGLSFAHFPRIADHLSKQVYALLSKPDRPRGGTLGPVLDEALRKIAEKLADADKRRLLEEQFTRVRAVLEDYPVAKTERFFDDPHHKEKGSGRLFTVAHNPASCTGCGLCVEVCPNGAHEWAEQTPELLGRKRKTWEFRMSVRDPDTAELEAFISASDPGTEVYRLLDKTAYHSMVGGDAAYPGNAVKTAVHLVTAAAESVMRPRFRAHLDKLDRLIARLEERIQGKVSRSLEINDFARFGESLNRLRREGVTAEALARIIDEEGGGRPIDPEALARLSALLGRVKEQRASYAEAESGTGRARMALAIDPGNATFWSGAYPYNPLRHPWVSHLAGDAPALAEGLHEGIVRHSVEEAGVLRQADLEAGDSYDSRVHGEFFEKFSAADMTDDEWNLVPPVVVVAHTNTVSIDEIARVLSAGRPLRVVVIDTDAISVPEAAGDPKAPEHAAGLRDADDLARLFLSRRDAFVLQTTVGHPGHLLRGVTRALRQKRPALFRIYAPDPQVSGIAPEDAARHARIACECRAFPLFTFDPDRGEDTALDLGGNPDPAEEWTTREFTAREPSGAEEKFTTPLTVADWAFREARFQGHFRIVPKGHLNGQMKPLSEYLALEPVHRAEYDPYIEVTDKESRHFLAIVSPAMARAALERAEFWAYLRRSAAAAAAPSDSPPAPKAGPAPAGMAPAAEPGREIDEAMRRKLTEALLGLAGAGSDPEFFRQTLSQFIERSAPKAEGGKRRDD